ncbi:hypothetical protein J6590_073430 [Homalodisca vitripennis]|nr:hypothetical protein J6590_073430 [Homalodisca vitripennis]
MEDGMAEHHGVGEVEWLSPAYLNVSVTLDGRLCWYLRSFLQLNMAVGSVYGRTNCKITQTHYLAIAQKRAVLACDSYKESLGDSGFTLIYLDDARISGKATRAERWGLPMKQVRQTMTPTRLTGKKRWVFKAVAISEEGA